MKDIKKYQKLSLIVVCFIYIAIRFWNLTEPCLFFDEIFSIHAAQHNWNPMFWFVAQDLIHPPLFYVLLKIWILIGGESLFFLRLFPVLFSIIALVPFYLLCRQLKLNYWSIIIAITFFAVNGCLIKYAQEVRMYSLLMCLGLFSLWLFVRYLNESKGFGWLLLLNILLVNTHNFGWLIVFSELFAVLILHSEKLKQILFSVVLSGLSFVPWIIAVWQASQINADYKQNLGWAAKPGLIALYRFLNDLFEPFYYQQTNADRAETIFITAPIILIYLISCVLYFLNWKDETEKKNTILLIIFLKTPILLALIASWILPVSVWGTRHLIIIFPLLAIFLGLILEKIKIRGLKIAFLSTIFFFISVAFVIQIFYGNQRLVWCAWEELAHDLETNKQTETTKLYVFEDLIAYHVWFALQDKSNTQISVVKGIEGLQEDKAYFIPRGFDEIKITDENGFEGDKFWIAFRDSKFNEYHPPLKNLKLKGYRIGEPKVFIAQGIQTFLVLVEKEK